MVKGADLVDEVHAGGGIDVFGGVEGAVESIAEGVEFYFEALDLYADLGVVAVFLYQLLIAADDAADIEGEFAEAHFEGLDVHEFVIDGLFPVLDIGGLAVGDEGGGGFTEVGEELIASLGVGLFGELAGVFSCGDL